MPLRIIAEPRMQKDVYSFSFYKGRMQKQQNDCNLFNQKKAEAKGEANK